MPKTMPKIGFRKTFSSAHVRSYDVLLDARRVGVVRWYAESAVRQGWTAYTVDGGPGSADGLRTRAEAATALVERVKDDPRCTAIIRHGPGHQSKTRCRVQGEHDEHEAVYMGQFATWRGDEAMTGFFDEPPDQEDDD